MEIFSCLLSTKSTSTTFCRFWCHKLSD